MAVFNSIIRRFIKRNKTINYLYKSLIGLRDSRIIDLVNDGVLKHHFKINYYGNQSDKIYYLIKIDEYNGYFAMLIGVLKYLSIASKYNFTPIVYISKNNFNFDEIYSKKIKSINVLQYFFTINQGELISDLNSLSYSKVIEAIYPHISIYDTLFNDNSFHYNIIKNIDFIDSMSDVMFKYLIFDKTLLDNLINEFDKLGLDEYFIGIHHRGTDFKYKLQGHPKFVEEELYFNKIDELLSSENYKSIFIATDDKLILQKYKAKYGDLLIYFDDVLRSSNNTGPHYLLDNDEYSKYQIGFEAIRVFLFYLRLIHWFVVFLHYLRWLEFIKHLDRKVLSILMLSTVVLTWMGIV
jgi:hypothetical protein